MQRNKIRSLPKFTFPLSIFSALVIGTAPRIAPAQEILPEHAVRFLEQSSFGANWTEIQNVQRLGYQGYLLDQFNMAPSGWTDLGLCPGSPGEPCTPTRDFYTMYPTQKQFFQKALLAPDQLRQRVVFALDQMWVISALLQGNFQAGWMNYYLTILENNAFGNWRQLMQNVTLSPAMGRYLDMSGNFFATGRAANENYAREILQLFNVGLDELNDDGTPRLDDAGNRIPTYNQEIVIGFSKAFTGWRLQPDVSQGVPNWRDPMMPVNPASNHDHTDKLLLDGVTLPARPETDPSCTNGCVWQDLNEALDNIFNNHNTPVYVCKNFIQYLVTSNPSPQQVSNCVTAFKGDDVTPRGDMKAMLTAILLDPEARVAPVNPDFGKLREPVLVITNLLRNFNVDGSVCAATGNPCTDFVLGEQFLPGNLRMDEDIFRSPTVFNFFPPQFVIGGTNLYGPEFAIQSTTTELARINMINALVYGAMATSADRPYGTRIDPDQMGAYYTGDDGLLIDGLNRILMHGAMSAEMHDLLVSQISGVTDPNAKAQKTVYLIATSSSYNVQR